LTLLSLLTNRFTFRQALLTSTLLHLGVKGGTRHVVIPDAKRRFHTGVLGVFAHRHFV
jgi:hypothetical protein